MFVYRFALLRELLHCEFDLHEVDRPIGLLILGNVALFVVGLLDDVAAKRGTWEVASGIVLAVVAVSLGILFIVFSVRLLNALRDLFGYLKPFC